MDIVRFPAFSAKKVVVDVFNSVNKILNRPLRQHNGVDYAERGHDKLSQNVGNDILRKFLRSSRSYLVCAPLRNFIDVDVKYAQLIFFFFL